MEIFYIYDGQDSKKKAELDSILEDSFTVKGEEVTLIKSPSNKKEDMIRELLQINEETPFCRGLIEIQTIVSIIAESEDSCGEKIILYIRNESNQIQGVMVFTFDYFDEDGQRTDKNELMYIHYLCTPFAGGFGKILMQICQQIGRKANAKQIKLLSTLPAVTFYQYMGFQLLPESEDDYNRAMSSNRRPNTSFFSRLTTSIFTSLCMPRRQPKRLSTYNVYEMIYMYTRLKKGGRPQSTKKKKKRCRVKSHNKKS
uniref:N-acetyltransferase domain-containing protein n=1 Tax=viral metagenome TaxID=1070528 RepID=A0A6C0I3R1_9ZZZZ